MKRIEGGGPNTLRTDSEFPDIFYRRVSNTSVIDTQRRLHQRSGRTRARDIRWTLSHRVK